MSGVDNTANNLFSVLEGHSTEQNVIGRYGQLSLAVGSSALERVRILGVKNEVSIELVDSIIRVFDIHRTFRYSIDG